MAVKDQKALTLPHLSGVDPDGTPSSRDTCGWISGRPESALTCHPGQRCAVDSARSLVGCCWTPSDGACRLSTRCLEDEPRSDGRDGGDVARTLDLVCRGEAAPYCKTDVFAADSILDGFSLLICGADRRTETAFRFTVDSSTASSPSSTNQTATSSSSLTASTPTSVGPSPLSTASLGSAPVTPAPWTAQYTPLPSSSASAASPWAVTGAILGSVDRKFRCVESPKKSAELRHALLNELALLARQPLRRNISLESFVWHVSGGGEALDEAVFRVLS
ncbi:hypothetical protein CDD80_6 [Ophiocordyceps camponoti-rufipedis]|uniref:Uncharacterized protein n=1 Tax=Ophiocordyceps camponoti-rufipedis TaxID=2004952 RepID=A0A2C5ZP33_9HYPO|nr:hypothetical protein CDD80_6 [Ophiocordyceps camponoti-rufipedis]